MRPTVFFFFFSNIRVKFMSEWFEGSSLVIHQNVEQIIATIIVTVWQLHVLLQYLLLHVACVLFFFLFFFKCSNPAGRALIPNQPTSNLGLGSTEGKPIPLLRPKPLQLMDQSSEGP